MKIDEAITTLEKPESLAIISLDPSLKDAVKLGIEALERLTRERKHGRCNVWIKLPSETTL